MDSRNTLEHPVKKTSTDQAECASVSSECQQGTVLFVPSLLQGSILYEHMANSHPLHPFTEKPERAPGDSCQFLYFFFIPIPMSRHGLTHVSFTVTSMAHTSATRISPEQCTQSSVPESQTTSLSVILPQMFFFFLRNEPASKSSLHG